MNLQCFLGDPVSQMYHTQSGTLLQQATHAENTDAAHATQPVFFLSPHTVREVVKQSIHNSVTPSSKQAYKIGLL